MSDESDWENEDILIKLKRHLDDPDINYYAGDLLHDAVDEIETLREHKKSLCLQAASLSQRVEQLVAALDKIVKMDGHHSNEYHVALNALKGWTRNV